MRWRNQGKGEGFRTAMTPRTMRPKHFVLQERPLATRTKCLPKEHKTDFNPVLLVLFFMTLINTPVVKMCTCQNVLQKYSSISTFFLILCDYIALSNVMLVVLTQEVYIW
jgi:hypothetical protein